jgi:hypothetical protein
VHAGGVTFPNHLYQRLEFRVAEVRATQDNRIDGTAIDATGKLVP